MKIGVISDIHSNIYALNAVLNEFERKKVDKIICCGDIIGIGPKPEETVQTLIQRKDILVIVRGNHEQYLLEGIPNNVHDNKRKISFDEIENHKWTHSRLSKSSKEFISELQLSNTIQVGEKIVYIVHYPNNRDGTYKKHIKEPSSEQNNEMFKEIDADIFIYGHTHTVSLNNENEKWYINPGSLGCPGKSNIANAGILDISENEIYYSQLSIEYDVNEAIQEIERIEYPFYKKILQIFY